MARYRILAPCVVTTPTGIKVCTTKGRLVDLDVVAVEPVDALEQLGAAPAEPSSEQTDSPGERESGESNEPSSEQPNYPDESSAKTRGGRARKADGD